MTKKVFGTTREGKTATEYILRNESGMEVVLTDLGATVVAIRLAGADGKVRDVVLGYDNPQDYQEHTCYFGAVIGRNANRIAGARITLEGKEYALEQNDNGNNLHSGAHGVHGILWDAKEESAQSVVFSCKSRDGEQDFPGNMDVQVTYTLTDENGLVINYRAKSDKTTVANFTNHSYFNLDGHDSGRIEGQWLEIFASRYTPVTDGKAIPTGELADVSGTPMDFRKKKKIGADIEADFEQLRYVGGYDHNYAVDGADGTLRLAARASAEESGIGMEVYTDCVGIQLYAGNFVTDMAGKEGVRYGARHGFCLETQYFPNAVNEPNFKKPVLHPGETYHSTTKYRFYTE